MAENKDCADSKFGKQNPQKHTKSNLYKSAYLTPCRRRRVTHLPFNTLPAVRNACSILCKYSRAALPLVQITSTHNDRRAQNGNNPIVEPPQCLLYPALSCLSCHKPPVF